MTRHVPFFFLQILRTVGCRSQRGPSIPATRSAWRSHQVCFFLRSEWPRFHPLAEADAWAAASPWRTNGPIRPSGAWGVSGTEWIAEASHQGRHRVPGPTRSLFCSARCPAISKSAGKLFSPLEGPAAGICKPGCWRKPTASRRSTPVSRVPPCPGLTPSTGYNRPPKAVPKSLRQRKVLAMRQLIQSSHQVKLIVGRVVADRD